MRHPLISVIMPAYNHEKYIGEAIESVLNQSFTDLEFIIINDGSTDNTGKIVKEFNDPRIRYFYQENKDAPSTLNRGISLANGKYISIINSDDVYHKERISYLLEIAKEQNVKFIITDMDFIDESSNLIKNQSLFYNRLKKIYLNKCNLEIVFLSGNLAMTSSNFFFDSIVPKEIGTFNPYRYAHDYDFALRALIKYQNNFKFMIHNYLLKYRIHNEGTIKESRIRANNEVFNIVKKMLPDFMNNELDRIYTEAACNHLTQVYDYTYNSLESMEKTISWKFTAPLRFLYKKYINILK